MAKPLTITGDRALQRALATLGDRVAKKVVRAAVTAGAKPIAKAAKSKVKSQSGTLKKALGTKVRANKNGTVTARIGARRGVTGTFKGKTRKPSRYAHLREKGFINAKGTFVPPDPFLRPAMDEQSGTAMDAIAAKLADGIKREAAKGAGR